MSSVITSLFTEKFRPKTLETLIAPPRVKEELSKGLIQNILLYGTPGTGKSSTGFILSKNHTTLYINAGEERGIDVVRERIMKFCSTISLEGGKEKLKCVFIDEVDGATKEFLKAILSVIERYASITRFIVTCNHIDEIASKNEAFLSRFHQIAYDPINAEEEKFINDEYNKRIAAILTAAKINYTEEVLQKFISNDFPDMRSILNKIQSLYIRGIKELNDKNFNINFDFEDLLNICLQKPEAPWENYKIIISNYSNKVDDALYTLGVDLPRHFKDKMPDKINKLPLIIISIAEHQAQRSMVIDPVITLLSAVFKIQSIIHS